MDIEDTKLISELGHFCVPEGASIKLTPLQRQIRDAFGSINYPTHAAMSVSEQSSVKQSPVIEIKDSSDTELIPAVPSQFTHVRDVLFLAVTVITSSIVAAVIALVINHKNSRGQDLVSSTVIIGCTWSVLSCHNSLHGKLLDMKCCCIHT